MTSLSKFSFFLRYYPGFIDDLFSKSFPCAIIYYSIVFTLPLWLTCNLYLVGSLLGWLLLFWIIFDQYFRPFILSNEKDSFLRVHWLIVIWTVGTLILLVSLIIGHLDFALGIPLLFKSTIGWAKGWALFPVYLFVGSALPCLNLISRALCVLGFFVCILVPISLLAPILNLPQVLYTGPLLFSPLLSFFDVSLYQIDGVTGALRWRLFTPWPTALGMLGNLYFWICILENNTKWRIFGISGCILMILMSKSRVAAVSILLILFVYLNIFLIRKIYYLFFLSFTSYFLVLLLPKIIGMFNNLWASIASARAASTRVRADLADFALTNWRENAYWWGHGTVVAGPKLVEGMSIGSHHTWLGLLFVKGTIGFLSFLIPFVVGLLFFLCKCIASDEVKYRSCAAVFLTLSIYTFSENLEILIYLYWPAIVVLGTCLSQKDATVTELV